MILGLIPARLNSQRLPGKPLLKIDGLPMVIHVLKRSLLSKKLDNVIVCAAGDLGFYGCSPTTLDENFNEKECVPLKDPYWEFV